MAFPCSLDEAQATIAFCSLTTAAIVLNALRPSGIEAPRERSRLRPEDTRYPPKSHFRNVARRAH